MNNRYALCGAPYSGVTTLAKNMASLYGWTHLNYSDTLKWLLARLPRAEEGAAPHGRVV
jgi:adenylate kinase family enzyme